MPLWIQNLVVFLMVGACVVIAAWRAVQTLRGRKKVGGCCAKGCGAGKPSDKPAGERIVFMPVEMLRRRK